MSHIESEARNEQSFQPLNNQELELLYDLNNRKRYYGLKDEETEAFQILDDVRNQELALLRPPLFREIVLGKFSEYPNLRRQAEEETERARIFYRECTSLPEGVRRARLYRVEELDGVIYGLRFDNTLSRINHNADLNRNLEIAQFILEEHTAVRPLISEEEQEYVELLSRLESGKISAREKRKLRLLGQRGKREMDLLEGDGLDSRAVIASAKLASAALGFFEEWEALTPEQQRARYDRIMELNHRAVKIYESEDKIKEEKKGEKEDHERARKVAGVIVRRSLRPEFERSIFQNGVLEFETPAAYFTVHPPMRGKETETIMWLEHFDGKVPKRWEFWGNIDGDFEKAKEAGVQLSSILIDAGVAYWHWHVVEAVASTQRLTPLQIAMALEGADAKHFRESILKGQREIGTPEDVIREAAYLFLIRGNFNLKDIPFRLDI